MNERQAGLIWAEMLAKWSRFPQAESTEEFFVIELARTASVEVLEEVRDLTGDLVMRPTGSHRVEEVYNFATAQVAVDALWRTWPDDHMPSLQALRAKMREVGQSTASPALPAPEPTEAERAAGAAALAAALGEYWAERPEEHLETLMRADLATPEQRDQWSRHIAQLRLDGSPVPSTARRVLPRDRSEAEYAMRPGPVSAFDFCLCGGAFVQVPRGEEGVRACGFCGAPEGERMTYEDRRARAKGAGGHHSDAERKGGPCGFCGAPEGHLVASGRLHT